MLAAMTPLYRSRAQVCFLSFTLTASCLALACATRPEAPAPATAAQPVTFSQPVGDVLFVGGYGAFIVFLALTR